MTLIRIRGSACQSLEETKEHRRGCWPPVNDATTNKAPRGRQRTEITDTEQVTCSVALSGLKNYG
jgi:hypothetical protein